jgi:hypothetical protein
MEGTVSCTHLSPCDLASGVHIYGAPRNQLQHPPADQEICVDRDPCIPLDTHNTYSSSNDNEEVLIWSDSWLNPNRNHQFVIRLTEAPPGKDNALKVMTLARVVYEIEDIYRDQPSVTSQFVQPKFVDDR